MRVPLSWLADYVDHELTTAELARRLTMSGLKVEAIEQPGAAWQDVVIGRVTELHPHPRSNKPLHVAQVSTGSDDITIVTGAQNVRLGDKVPVIPVGGLVPYGPDGQPLEIVPRPMAGITSQGMLASARELGISDEHSGIYILPADSPVGRPLTAIMGGDVLDLETVSNRPDTLSILGVAREVAAITEQQMTPPDLAALGDGITWLDEESIALDVQDRELCPRFSALRIEGVEALPSPSWLVERLQAAGQRPINVLVDLTNYVMLEIGQPMHAFDGARLATGRIGVRRSRPGESLRTLDGVDRALPPGTGVVTDGDQPTSVAGVMGGEESEIGEGTTTLILEAANWHPVSIRRAAQALGLRTEASSRFEKGQPAEQTVQSLLRYVQLLAQISEKPLRVARLVDVWEGNPVERTVAMPLRDLDRLTGVRIPAERAAEVLSLLGFDVTSDDDAITVGVPYWRRVDIEQSADVVEEVIRLVGFDTLPSTLPRRTMPPPALSAEMQWDTVVRERLLSGGASEISTHSLTSLSSTARLFRPGHDGQDYDLPETWAALVPNPLGVTAAKASTVPVRLLNPASTDRQILRMTLLPALLDVVSRNLKQSDEQLTFFEIDHTFFTRGSELPYERRSLALVLSGNRRPRTWADRSPGAYTFYDVKGMVEAVLRALRIVRGVRVEAAPHPALHPGRSAILYVDDQPAGYLGELHPQVAGTFDIAAFPAQVAEIDLDVLYAAANEDRPFTALPRYPAVYRDLAAVLNADVRSSDLMDVVNQAGGELLESARIFDVYQGEPLPSDKKSVAVEMVFRSGQTTLTQEDVASVMSRIVDHLDQRLGAALRD